MVQNLEGNSPFIRREIPAVPDLVAFMRRNTLEFHLNVEGGLQTRQANADLIN